jgi:hypothetical protein
MDGAAAGMRLYLIIARAAGAPRGGGAQKKARFPRSNPNGRILHGIEILDDTTIAVIIAEPPLPHTLDVAANIMRRED